MKQRLLTGWNFRRIIFLLAGTSIIIQSAIIHEWVGVLLGGYFVCMGLFALGCASGNCFLPNDYKQMKSIDKEIGTVDFEEIK